MDPLPETATTVPPHEELLVELWRGLEGPEKLGKMAKGGIPPNGKDGQKFNNFEPKLGRIK